MKYNNMKKIALLTAACFTTSIFAQQFQTDLGWLNQALRNAKKDVRSVGKFQKYNEGQKDFIFPNEIAPWGANYYPMVDNGIANRWQIKWNKREGLDGDTKKDIIQTARAKKLTPVEISLLSPAEKLDLYLGNYDFKITKRELRARGPLRRPTPKGWEGFCNGVRIAGVLTPEPIRPITVTNEDGLEIEFQPADLKALAGAAHFYVKVYNQIGSPTRSGNNQNLPNAGVFDIALRTFLGENKRGFVIDVHPGDEIWNETVMGYQRDISNKVATTESERREHNGATKKVEVSLLYLALGEFHIEDSNGFTGDQTVSRSNRFSATYDLYLDDNDKIVDGEWKSGRYPDFAWFGFGAGDKYHSRRGQSGNPHIPFSKILPLMKKASKAE